MKTVIATVSSVLLLLISACSSGQKTSEISQTELVSRINDNSAPVVLDVRTVKQYNDGHVPGAINTPYENYRQVLAGMELAKSDEIVVYCEDGSDAKKLKNYLKKQGFFEVRHLQYDMKGWRKAKLPTQ